MAVDPWTLYWQNDNPESCVATQNPEDRERVAAFWHELANQLAAGEQVLDLACGNGVVAAHLLAAKPALKITGVDRANISPASYLNDSSAVDKVIFVPETNITALPFPDGAFDVVTSQFGLEYAPLAEASQEAARVLRAQGRVCLLVHHAESEVVVPSRRQLKEINALLAPDSLLSKLQLFVVGELDLSALESAGQLYLETDGDKTRQISGQIFPGINRIIDLFNSDTFAAQELASSMHTRLQADQQRLQQLSDAALDVQGWQAFVSRFEDLGVNVQIATPFHLKDDNDESGVIAWQLVGVKA